MKSLFFGLFLILCFYIVFLSIPNKTVFKMLMRLKWLFVSIFVIYLWLTPGTPIWSGMDWPSREGLLLAVHRSLVLVLIIVAVDRLLTHTSREQLIQGLYWLLYPFGFLGLDRNRLATRLALTMQFAFEENENGLSDKGNGAKSMMARVNLIAVAVMDRFQSAVKHEQDVEEISITTGQAPMFSSLIIPLLLGLLFFLVERF